jgi:hypothetical protein
MTDEPFMAAQMMILSGHGFDTLILRIYEMKFQLLPILRELYDV